MNDLSSRLAAEQRATDASVRAMNLVFDAIFAALDRATPKHPTDDDVLDVVIDEAVGDIRAQDATLAAIDKGRDVGRRR